MSLPEHPRRRMVVLLRHLSAEMRAQISHWNQPQSHYDFTTRPPVRTPLTDAEKVENRSESWEQLAEAMDRTIRLATIMRDQARERAAELRGEGT